MKYKFIIATNFSRTLNIPEGRLGEAVKIIQPLEIRRIE